MLDVPPPSGHIEVQFNGIVFDTYKVQLDPASIQEDNQCNLVC